LLALGLQDFAVADFAQRARERANHRDVIGFRHQPGSLGKHHVPTQYDQPHGKGRIQGSHAPALQRVVDQVVVDQRRGVEHLDARGDRENALRVGVVNPPGMEGQRRRSRLPPPGSAGANGRRWSNADRTDCRFFFELL
jgi:hypothetical protein